jgi:hypothetical protein
LEARKLKLAKKPDLLSADVVEHGLSSLAVRKWPSPPVDGGHSENAGTDDWHEGIDPAASPKASYALGAVSWSRFVTTCAIDFVSNVYARALASQMTLPGH